MKAFKLISMLMLVALVFSSVSVLAQQNDNESSNEEEVIIIKEKTDADGNVEVKKIIRKGDSEDIIIETTDGGEVEIIHGLDDLEDIHIIELEELDGLSEELQEKLKDINIEIDEIDEDRHIKIIIDNEAGEDNDPVIIEWKGDGEIPDDVKQKMEEHGVKMNGEGFGHVPSHGFIKGKFPKNKACLGVMIGKTVENENGVEKVTGESEEGVAILDVFENSGAADAGLLKDDIITAINGEDVTTIHEVLDVLKPYEGGATVSIEYLRDKQPEQTTATLKACENKFNFKKIERHSDVDVDVDEDFEWVFEKEANADAEVHKKRTIVIKKRNSNEAEIEAFENEVDDNETAATDPVSHTTTSNEEVSQTLELQEVSMYPNPTAGNLTVEFKSDAVPTTVKIMDITGKVVYSEEILDFDGTYKKEINLSDAPKGALMMTVIQNDKVYADKVMVQ